MILTGPPGGGKGTQAEVMAGRLGVPVISTGDTFRAQVAAGTELGRRAQGYLDEGEYVPDEVTNAMVLDRLTSDDTRPGFLLDGYPRTLEQVAVLDEFLDAHQRRLDAVVALEVPPDELIPRLLHRAQLEHRSDDTEDVIRRRLEVYDEYTRPLIKEYAARGRLIPVDGTGEIAEVANRILTVADSLLYPHA